MMAILLFEGSEWAQAHFGLVSQIAPEYHAVLPPSPDVAPEFSLSFLVVRSCLLRCCRDGASAVVVNVIR